MIESYLKFFSMLRNFLWYLQISCMIYGKGPSLLKPQGSGKMHTACIGHSLARISRVWLYDYLKSFILRSNVRVLDLLSKFLKRCYVFDIYYILYQSFWTRLTEIFKFVRICQDLPLLISWISGNYWSLRWQLLTFLIEKCLPRITKISYQSFGHIFIYENSNIWQNFR